MNKGLVARTVVTFDQAPRSRREHDRGAREIKWSPKDVIDRPAKIGAATASGELKKLGIRNPFIQDPATMTTGKCIAGPVLTLRFMHIKEDQYHDGGYVEPEPQPQLRRHVPYHTQPDGTVAVNTRAI